MKVIIITIVAVAALSMGNAAIADTGINFMIGTWKWEGFTIKVEECEKTAVCAKVVSGAKNVSLQMIKSKLTGSKGDFVGKVAHP